MKSKASKLIIFLLFLGLLIGVGVWMNLKFVKGHPKVKVQNQRINFDRLGADSAIESQEGYKR